MIGAAGDQKTCCGDQGAKVHTIQVGTYRRAVTRPFSLGSNRLTAMHIVITDSGVGGLSVCASAERFVRVHGYREPVRLTFVNAAPANDYGYNSMPSRQVKLDTFDRFLRAVTEQYAPDVIYVACNTLSVLLSDTPYVAESAIPITGIVETGSRLVLSRLAADRESVAMIFATPTTIDSGVYPRLLVDGGIDRSRIITQACPGLADVISEDREGTRARSEIVRWVGAAVDRLNQPAHIVACLACTHYGYRKDIFASALAGAEVIDPNERAVDDLFGDVGSCHDVTVECVTRYAIPETAVEALAWFLGDTSPPTVVAMRGFIHRPDLF
jgi:glutamate racemase